MPFQKKSTWCPERILQCNSVDSRPKRSNAPLTDPPERRFHSHSAMTNECLDRDAVLSAGLGWYLSHCTAITWCGWCWLRNWIIIEETRKFQREHVRIEAAMQRYMVHCIYQCICKGKLTHSYTPKSCLLLTVLLMWPSESVHFLMVHNVGFMFPLCLMQITETVSAQQSIFVKSLRLIEVSFMDLFNYKTLSM